MHWIYAHLIGDYILQNDWLAEGKKRVCCFDTSGFYSKALRAPEHE